MRAATQAGLRATVAASPTSEAMTDTTAAVRNPWSKSAGDPPP
jgi:hypothetical protein